MLDTSNVRDLLSRPPTDQDGRAHYIAISYRMTSLGIKKLRQQYRGKPIAIVSHNDRVDLISILDPPLPVARAMTLATALIVRISPFYDSFTPYYFCDRKWICPKLSARDIYRICLAIAGEADLGSVGSIDRNPSMCWGVVENNVGTHTFVGSKS